MASLMANEGYVEGCENNLVDCAHIKAVYSEFGENDKLIVSEDTAKKYLKDSIGYDNVEGLKKVDFPFRNYENGIFEVTGYEVGDFYLSDPVLMSATDLSENEILVKASINSCSYQVIIPIQMTVKLKKNPDSIWGGYTLMEVVEYIYN